MATEPRSKPRELQPPYIAWSSLLGLLDKMATDGLPSRVDKSYLHNHSGATQTQILAALRSLELIGSDGVPTQALQVLVQEEGKTRQEAVASLLASRYPAVVELGRTNATQGQLEDAFQDMGVTGDTRRKAVAFFLKAADYAGVSVSRNWTTPRVSAAGSTRKSARPRVASPPKPESEGRQEGPEGRDLHPFLVGLLRELPAEGGDWTRGDRDRWLEMAALTLDMLYPTDQDE